MRALGGPFLVLLLTGCAADVADPHPDPPALPDPLSFDARDCTRVFVAVFRPIADAQALLPEGFTAARATAFFGQRALPSDDGVVLLSAATCDAHAEAMVGVFVEPPDASEVEPAPSNVYDLARAAPAGPLAGALAALEWPRLGNVVEATYTAGVPIPAAHARVSDPEGDLLVMEASAPLVGDEFREHVRWWHAAPRALAYVDYEFTLPGQLGPGTCEARAGTIAETALGATECPDDTLFLVGPPFDMTVRFAALRR